MKKPNLTTETGGKTPKKLANPPKREKKAEVFRSREKLQSFKEIFAAAKIFSILPYFNNDSMKYCSSAVQIFRKYILSK